MQLELKLEYQGEHATFLYLDTTIEDNIFAYKLFGKGNKFPFFIVLVPYMSNNIPSSIFYGSIHSEFLRIARCTDFVPKASQLYTRMVTRGRIKYPTSEKKFQRSTEIFFTIVRHMTK